MDGFAAAPQSVCIVGLGLMGGSLALAWQAAAAPWRVIGVDCDPATLEHALASGAVAAVTPELAEGVAAADAVVLATPVRTILRLLPETGRHAHPGSLILDLGSSKSEICAALAGLPAGLEPVGAHPMCGSERAGFAAADAGLYRGRPFVLCPLPRTSEPALAAAQALAQAAGARPILATPEAHDAAVAAISHLPYAAAAALVATVEATGDPLAWALAASGFRDTTRVAAGDVDVMLDTLLTNRAAVLRSLDGLAGQLATLRAALAEGDETALYHYLSQARRRRAGWHPDVPTNS